MKLIKSKYWFVLGYLILHSISFTYSQCDIKLFEKQNDILIFHSKDISDSLHCYVHVYLTYLIDNTTTQNGGGITDIEINSIEMKKKFNNQKVRVLNCFDTMDQCICDTLSKYIRLYYKDPNRLLTESELNALEIAQNKYINCIGNVKVELCFSSIYIYPYRKNKKSEYYHPPTRHSVPCTAKNAEISKQAE